MPTPDFRLTLDGRDLTPTVQPRLVSLTLTEKRGDDADQLDIVLSDHDGRLALPKRGAEISLQLGWRRPEESGAQQPKGSPPPGLVDKGRFKVDEVEHSGSPDVVTIRARAADFTAALRRRRQRSWRATTLGAVLREVAAAHGLQARVSPELASIAVPVLDQSRQSDAALLTRLGRDNDAVASVKAGRLVFTPIGSGVTASGRRLPQVALTRADGDQHRWSTAERDNYTGVTAEWHDTGQAARRTVAVGGQDNAKRLRRTFASEAAARRAAQAEMGRVRRGVAKFAYALALGRPDIYPEQRVRVSGFKPEIDAVAWLVEQAVHTLGEGLTTALELETAP